MANYQLLITDVTNCGDLRCVAGWDLDRGKMVRPEPYREGFGKWTRLPPPAALKSVRHAHLKVRSPILLRIIRILPKTE